MVTAAVLINEGPVASSGRGGVGLASEHRQGVVGGGGSGGCAGREAAARSGRRDRLSGCRGAFQGALREPPLRRSLGPARLQQAK